MPLPFGVYADTGQYLSGVTDKDLDEIQGDHKSVRARMGQNKRLGAVFGVEPNKLDQAGWGIIFPAQGDNSAIKDALAPLIELRKAQAKRPELFKVFEGPKGYRPGDTTASWLARFGVGIDEVDPENGVPLYLLLVGSPKEIPFDFQYLLDGYWNVGRLHLEKTEDYRAYALAVDAYERATKPAHRKRAAMWMTKNPGDKATALLHNQVGLPFAKGVGTKQPLGQQQGFQLSSILGDNATKPALIKLLQGQDSGGPTALLFTGSHGLAWSTKDPGGLAEKQGALVTQEWIAETPVQANQYFAAAELPDGAQVGGMIHVLFACFGGGCPETDNFGRKPNGDRISLAPEPLIARFPQRMLARGALAVMAHVDRAWAYSFQTSGGHPRAQGLRGVMERIMAGERIGQATDVFNQRWSRVAGQLQMMLDQQDQGLQPVVPAALANLAVARDDARNYIILGDPAVRLRVEEMEG